MGLLEHRRGGGNYRPQAVNGDETRPSNGLELPKAFDKEKKRGKIAGVAETGIRRRKRPRIGRIKEVHLQGGWGDHRQSAG